MATGTILIPGGMGQVGCEVTRQARALGLVPVAMSSSALDITDPAAVAAAMEQHEPDLVINCAAYTAVDKAESDEDAAYAVNRDGAANLAVACAASSVPLLHISTDYVFAGDKTGAYGETDPTGPTGVYGASKLAGERAVAEKHADHVILRTAWVYGLDGGNFIKTMLRLGRERGAVSVVDDQYGAPTHAADIAETLLTIGQSLLLDNNAPEKRGIFHYTGDGEATWCRFAAEVFAVLEEVEGVKVDLTPVTTAQFPTAARRPANSLLLNGKVLEFHGISPKPWTDRVRAATSQIIKEGF